jgi:hypothetical protein
MAYYLFDTSYFVMLGNYKYVFISRFQTLGRVISKPDKAEEGKFSCPLDEQLFGSKVEFDRHFRLVHTVESGLL